MGRASCSTITMRSLVLLLLCLTSTLAAPDTRALTCSECVAEMHKLRGIIRLAAKDIEAYLIENYCPTLPDDSHACEHDIALHYVQMLYTIIDHFFVDGAVHICETMGACEVRDREYTCEECVEGLEWVKMYMEDPIMVAEYTIYLEQNFCNSGMPFNCKEVVAVHFPPMHNMAMDRFMIPQEICNQEPVCGATFPPKPTTQPPTVPPM